MADNTTSSILSSLLSYMDKPWKVISIIFLIVIGVVVYTVYENRREIASTIIQQYESPHLLPDQFTALAPKLLAQSKADVTQLMVADLQQNLLQAQLGYSKAGEIWLPNVSPHPLITEHTDPRTILAIIQSVPKCITVTSEMPILHAEYEAGLRRMCVIGVPPVIGIVSGLLYVGWMTPPNAADEDSAKSALLIAGAKVAAW